MTNQHFLYKLNTSIIEFFVIEDDLISVSEIVFTSENGEVVDSSLGLQADMTRAEAKEFWKERRVSGWEIQK